MVFIVFKPAAPTPTKAKNLNKFFLQEIRIIF